MRRSIVKRKPVVAVLFSLVALISIFAPELFADIRPTLVQCNGNVITLGMRQAEVRSKCGEPTDIQTREEVRVKRDMVSTFRGRPPEGDPDTPGYVKELIRIEEWEYNPGRNGFIRYFTFENGVLLDINLGGRGY